MKEYVEKVKLTSMVSLGTIRSNGFSYPEWWRDMDPRKPSNLFSSVKKGAKPFADACV